MPFACLPKTILMMVKLTPILMPKATPPLNSFLGHSRAAGAYPGERTNASRGDAAGMVHRRIRVVAGLGLGLGGVADDALAVQVTLLLDLNVRFVEELIALLDVPLGHEVVLDPDDLVEGLDEGCLALDVEARVREDGFGHDVLDEAEADSQVDVFDMQGVLTAETNVHHAELKVSQVLNSPQLLSDRDVKRG